MGKVLFVVLFLGYALSIQARIVEPLGELLPNNKPDHLNFRCSACTGRLMNKKYREANRHDKEDEFSDRVYFFHVDGQHEADGSEVHYFFNILRDQTSSKLADQFWRWVWKNDPEMEERPYIKERKVADQFLYRVKVEYLGEPSLPCGCSIMDIKAIPPEKYKLR